MASSCGSSYASSLETTNYARICRIVVDVLRDILWQVLTNEILPSDLPEKVQNNEKKKLKNLNLKIKTWLLGISPLSTEIPSAEKFDVSSLYTLIRNLCSQVPAPSTQWGQIPPTGGITLGDDIERVRQFRNILYGHATQAKIENADFNKLCIEIKDVARRFDKYFSSKAMKCDFQREIDTILTCFMDKSLGDDYIDKMIHIAILSEKDKVEDTTDSLVNEERDCTENSGISHEDIALEMPQGTDGKICIIKCYVDLKLELERDTAMDIAKDLFKNKKHKDKFEEIAKPESRRHCIDQLLKRVLHLDTLHLKIFFDLLKRKCPERAKKLAEIKVTDKDRENFTQVSESVQTVSHRIQNGVKFEPRDFKFFECHFEDRPEKVDKRADVLLSQFRISICDHSKLIKENDPVKKIDVWLEKVQSCHFDSELEVQSVLGSKLYQKLQCFLVDGSRQGLENQVIWYVLQERIQSYREYSIKHFRVLRINFMEARRGSLVLKFETMKNFDVKSLTPEAVKTKVWDMIRTLCPDYQDLFKEPVHLTIFVKPLSNTEVAACVADGDLLYPFFSLSDILKAKLSLDNFFASTLYFSDSD
ncbi:hypothetical protein ACJMK2_009677 [Sinanodonta woodiana]|uniref:DZIP3-like HEPN domain-containing protein n=1 Tax=Sinanodonta woodiana TaxID=1069815 RepID=A0ABD3VD14_SINWO